MILRTPRLELDTPDMDDAELFAEWLNDSEVVKYSEQRHKKHTQQSQLDYWLSSATAAPNCVYTIYQDPEVGNPIGSVAVRIDQHNDIADVGIMIGDKSVWGQGYGFEAWECVCNYLVVEKKIRRIEAGCMFLNTPMIRICIKYGMRHDAIVPGHFLVDGKPVNLHLYGKRVR